VCLLCAGPSMVRPHTRLAIHTIVPGIGQTLGSLARMVGPTLGGMVFAWSERNSEWLSLS
jgi:hypothetical protein